MRTRETVFWGIYWASWGTGGMRWLHWTVQLMSLASGSLGALISPAIALYLVEAVLVPRVPYPLTVATFTPDQIRRLESRAMRWVLPKLDLTRSFSRALIRSPLEMG